MMYWIYDYPSWAIGLLFAVVFVAITWGGFFSDTRYCSLVDPSATARK